MLTVITGWIRKNWFCSCFPLFQVSVFPAACSLILVQPGQLAFVLIKTNPAKIIFLPDWKVVERGGAEPFWAPVVRPVYGPVTSLAVQDAKAAWESILKVCIAPLPQGTPAPGLLEETPLPPTPFRLGVEDAEALFWGCIGVRWWPGNDASEGQTYWKWLGRVLIGKILMEQEIICVY